MYQTEIDNPKMIIKPLSKEDHNIFQTLRTLKDKFLPNLAFINGIHARTHGTFKIPREFFHIRKGSSDPKHVRRVNSGQHAQF